jgi:hypothetical protein
LNAARDLNLPSDFFRANIFLSEWPTQRKIKIRLVWLYVNYNTNNAVKIPDSMNYSSCYLATKLIVLDFPHWRLEKLLSLIFSFVLEPRTLSTGQGPKYFTFLKQVLLFSRRRLRPLSIIVGKRGEAAVVSRLHTHSARASREQ